MLKQKIKKKIKIKMMVIRNLKLKMQKCYDIKEGKLNVRIVVLPPQEGKFFSFLLDSSLPIFYNLQVELQ